MGRVMVVLAAIFFFGLMWSSAHAMVYVETIAYTSFEEPGTGSKYTDKLGADTDHVLVNNSGEATVDYHSTGGELGFSSYYINTRGDVGLTDGDFVGVTAYTGDVAAFVDGTQGFEISDPDGKMTVALDSVNLLGYDYVSLSLSYFLTDVTWETSPPDKLRIWVEVDNGVEIDLLNTDGSDIDDLLIEGQWNPLFADLTGYTVAQLYFELDSNAADETLYIDDVEFLGSPVPVPAALWLMGSGLLCLFGIRRKKK